MSEHLHHELQRHASGLRDLAQDLLRDAHAAEDVTQATLQQALAQRNLQPGPLGGWLYRTVVNFARQWRRGERRRTARELSVPVREPVPAVAEQLARREMLQRVTDAVLRLDEPYQTTVFLRYFEDLPPRVIAHRTATNVITVKSRLARGLAMLRTRLHRGDGERDPGWRAALAITFGLPTIGAAWPIPTGTLLVSTTTKTLFVAGTLCLGGLLAYQFGDDPTPVNATTSGSANAQAAVAAAGALDQPNSDTERAAAIASADALPWLAHPFTVELEVLVVDALGLPVEGHTLRLAPFACKRNDAEHATGADGRVVISWATRQRTMDIQLVDPRGQARRVTLHHGQRTKLALLGDRSRTSEWLRSSVKLRETRLFSSPIFTNSNSGNSVRMHAGLHPHAVFGDLLARVPAEPSQQLEGPELSFKLSLGTLDLGDRVLGVSTLMRTEEPTATIDGVVFGVDGKPAAKVPVALLGLSPQPLQRGETDDEGRFQFANVVAGEFTVRAGGDHQGLTTATAIVTKGSTPCTLNLQRGAIVQGRAIDGAGKPRADHIVEWRALDGSACDATKTHSDGSFLFANMPANPGCLFLFASEGNKNIPLAIAASVLPDTNDVVLAADGTRGSILRIEPPQPGGEVAPAVLLWHADTGLGLTMQAPEAGTVWASPKLPAAFYDVELRIPGLGSKAIGRHWLDGEHDFDLGRIEAPRGGTVRITIDKSSLPSTEQQAIEITALRPDLDVRAEPSPLALDRPIQLPVGNYALAFRHADGGVRFHRFTVAADQETRVAPGP